MKILFISSGSIGDAIISTGILGGLMEEYPEAMFTVAVGPAAMPLFETCPQIERVISVFDGFHLEIFWILRGLDTY